MYGNMLSRQLVINCQNYDRWAKKSSLSHNSKTTRDCAEKWQPDFIVEQRNNVQSKVRCGSSLFCTDMIALRTIGWST